MHLLALVDVGHLVLAGDVLDVLPPLVDQVGVGQVQERFEFDLGLGLGGHGLRVVWSLSVPSFVVRDGQDREEPLPQ